MIVEPSPFRKLWVSWGKLRERLEFADDPETKKLVRQLSLDIATAELEFQLLNRGVGEN